MQEIQLLRRISFDRNIVQFYGACLESQPPMLVMEYMAVRSPLHLCEGSLGRGFQGACLKGPAIQCSSWRTYQYAGYTK